ncbi:unnamed protein product, partial [marine sediment metagenome]
AVRLNQAADDTAGYWYYGPSKTALINKKLATVAITKRSAVITLLTTGIKYYFQYRSSAPDGSIGIRSGIYYGVPD